MNFKKIWLFVVAAAFFYAGYVFADVVTIGTIAENVTKSFQQLGKLMAATSYLSGFGFAIAGVFKFKQHKDNPTQIPMGTPIALLVVGIVLIFLPGIISPMGVTIYGTQAATNNAVGGFTGTGVSNMPGGKTT